MDIMATRKNTQAAPATPVAPQVIQAAPHHDLVAAQGAFDAIIARFTSAAMDTSNAKDAANEASDAERGIRIVLLCELAKAACDGDWSLEHANAGVDAAVEAFANKASNDPKHAKQASTLRQFAGECKRAIHPKARLHVEAAFDQADEIWDEEGGWIDDAKAEAAANGTKYQRDSVDTPLRDVFKRKYHMVVGSNGMLAAHASDDPLKAAVADDPVQLAGINETSAKRDNKRAANAIRKALETIEAIADEFPAPQWGTVIKFLSGLDANKLLAYRDAQDRQRKLEARERPTRQRAAAPTPAVTADAVNAAADEMME